MELPITYVSESIDNNKVSWSGISQLLPTLGLTIQAS